MARLTEPESEHVRERPGGVEYDVELARLEQGIPPRDGPPECLLEVRLEDQQRRRVGESENGPHHELGVLEADQGDDRLAEAGQQDRANKRPGHGPGEVEMVVLGGEPLPGILRRHAIHKYVMGRLEVERFLDLGIGHNDQVNDDQRRYGQ